VRILYIDIDCCRADHVGINGYGRDTTPNIDRIARDGVSFRNCHTPNSPCLPSRAALFTGRFGFNNGVVAHHGTGERLRPNNAGHGQDPDKPFFIWQLWRHGYRTVAFSSFHDRHNAWWWTAGWDEIHSNRKGGQEIAHEIVDPALDWLENNAEQDNWFVDVHLWDAHSHYRAPDEWLEKYFDEPLPTDFPTEEAVQCNLDIYGPRSGRDLYTGYPNNERPNDMHPEGVNTRADAKRLIDMYDGSIAYVDDQIGRIFDLLERKGLLEDTAVIVSADHGDSFGEHGQYMDHGIANVPVHNVPMIVRWPGLEASGVDDSLCYTLDLCPTVCELLDIPIPTGWDGESFIAALNAAQYDGRPYLVMDHGIYTFSRSVRTQDMLLMQMLHPGLYPYDDQFYLHDLNADPHQQVNLYPENTADFAELSGMYWQWRHEQVLKGGAPDPLEAMVPLGPFIYYSPESMDARLRATGRSQQADELRERLARYHGDSSEILAHPRAGWMPGMY
jgi:choline-sulfatase